MEALTRQSAIEERLADAAERNNQQLKIVGDKALRACFSIILLGKLADETNEAQLHACETELISQASLTKIARKLNIEKYLTRGEGEQQLTDQMRADSAKALIGAIFQDAQKFDVLLKVICKLWDDKIEDIVSMPRPI